MGRLPKDTASCIRIVFDYLLNSEILDHIVSLTRDLITNPRDYNGQRKIDGEFSLDHLKLWIAGELVMSICPQPSIEDYWRVDHSYYGCKWIQDRVSRDLFTFITSVITFDVLSLIQQVRTNFQAHWMPVDYAVIDEMIVPFQGRSQHRVHIRGKPWSDGLKLFGMADKRSSLWSFFLYQGSASERATTTRAIVEDFVNELPPKPYLIIGDAYYGSLDLAIALHNNNNRFILGCGKNRPARYFSDLLHPQLKGQSKGSCVYASQYECQAVSIKDNTIVNFLTNTSSTATIMATQTRKDKTSASQQIVAILQAYRERLGRVDNVDGSLAQFMYPHRATKWTLALLRGVIRLCLHNTWVIVRSRSDDNLSIRLVIEEVIDHLASNIGLRLRSASLLPTPARSRHKYDISPIKSACLICSSSELVDPKRTFGICVACNVHIHKKCFAHHVVNSWFVVNYWVFNCIFLDLILW